MNTLSTNLIIALSILLLLSSCARNFISVEKELSNDLKFNSTKFVILDLDIQNSNYIERYVTLNESKVIKSGMLKPDIKIIMGALQESLSFDGKSVLTKKQYENFKENFKYLRPNSGYKNPQLDALVKLKISYNVQTGRYEREKVYNFYRRSKRCQYLKNPPPKYEACQWTEDTSWDEVRLEKNAYGLVDIAYSGEIFINEKDEFTHHRSFDGNQIIKTPYKDENILSQNIAAGLGPVISNSLGKQVLSMNLEIDEGNHNNAIDFLLMGNIEEARRKLEDDIENNFFNSSTDYYNLGLIYHSYGDLNIALDYYTKAIEAGGYKRLYVEAIKNIKVLNEESTL